MKNIINDIIDGLFSVNEGNEDTKKEYGIFYKLFFEDRKNIVNKLGSYLFDDYKDLSIKDKYLKPKSFDYKEYFSKGKLFSIDLIIDFESVNSKRNGFNKVPTIKYTEKLVGKFLKENNLKSEFLEYSVMINRESLYPLMVVSLYLFEPKISINV